ncbi:MAG: Fic family protein [Burkholderiales bacterium]|nr:Fic family protein [Burkholderiales bacterium]
MSTPNEKLANSLEVLSVLQNRGMRAIPSSALTRAHRERLLKNGFLEEVVKGWYITVRPGEAKGDSTAWYANMGEFIASYCRARFGSGWHVSPEQSLTLRSGERTLPKQIQLWAPTGNNQPLSLPHGCSLFLYRSPKLLPASEVTDAGGLRLVELPDALVAVGPGFFIQRPLVSQIALQTLADASDLARALLAGSHSVVAGRLAGALRAIGRSVLANDILNAMREAGYTVNEANPFAQALYTLPGGRPESPYAQRLRLMWAQMREIVMAVFPRPRAIPVDSERLLEDIEARYVADAYHSLSIEGYRVTPELIEQIRNGTWDPDGADRKTRDAMAAKGYFEAHKLVKEDIVKVISGENPGEVSRVRLAEWYRALFSPSVQAGILRPADLAGYRNDQVFIKGALHVPLSKEAVRDCMPVFFEQLEKEEHSSVRAVLGHFLFAYIHPYMDGNGRLARFLMNLMLSSGGYVWTVIPVGQRPAYMDALEQASSFNNIEPFARFVAHLVTEQTGHPLARPV